METVTVEEAKKAILAYIEATHRLEQMTSSPENAQMILKAAHLIADDPTQSEYAQKCCWAMLRGREAGRQGLSPGQAVDQEVDRQRRERGEDDHLKGFSPS